MKLEERVGALQTELEDLLAMRRQATRIKGLVQSSFKAGDATRRESRRFKEIARRAFDRLVAVNPDDLQDSEAVPNDLGPRPTDITFQRSDREDAWEEADAARIKTSAALLRIITAVSVGKERAQRELEKGKELWELAENLRKSANEELRQAREAVEQMFLDGQQVQELLGLESSPVPKIPEGSATFEEHWDEVAGAEAVDRTFPEEQEVQDHPELPSSPVAEPPPQPSTDDEPHHSVTGAEWSDPNAADRTSFQDIGPFPVPESKPVPTANGKSHEFTSESSKLGEVAGGKGRGSGRNFVKASSELVREVAARGLDRAVSFPKEWEPKSEGRLSDRLGIPEVDGRLRGLDTDFRGTGYHLTPSGNGTPGDGEVIKKELSNLRRSLETIRSS